MRNLGGEGDGGWCPGQAWQGCWGGARLPGPQIRTSPVPPEPPCCQSSLWGRMSPSTVSLPTVVGAGGFWVERPRKHWAAAESGSTDVPGPRASSCPSTPETSACSVPRLPSPLPPPGLKAPAWLGGEAPRLGPEYLVPAPPPRWHLANPPALNSVPLDPSRGKGTPKHLGDHPS